MWTIIVVIFKVIRVILSIIFKHNKEVNEKKKEALKEVVGGIKKRDSSRITAGLDRINRL